MSDMDNMTDLSADLSEVINRFGMENPSGTPDFILGDFLTSVLASYNDAVQKRAEWRDGLTAGHQASRVCERRADSLAEMGLRMDKHGNLESV